MSCEQCVEALWWVLWMTIGACLAVSAVCAVLCHDTTEPAAPFDDGEGGEDDWAPAADAPDTV